MQSDLITTIRYRPAPFPIRLLSWFRRTWRRSPVFRACLVAPPLAGLLYLILVAVLVF